MQLMLMLMILFYVEKVYFLKVLDKKGISNDVFTVTNSHIKRIWGVINFFVPALSESPNFVKIFQCGHKVRH